MPKHDLPKFNGQNKAWPSFYEQFLASVDSTSYSRHSTTQLPQSISQGEALKLVSHLPLSNSNYKIALKSLALQQRSLQLKPLRSESASEL